MASRLQPVRRVRAAPGAPAPPPIKTFTEIRADCLRDGRLFEDPAFEAADRSVFYSKSPPQPIVWKRPPELVSNPQLLVGGASRFDVKQGQLDDSWLLAALASLTCNQAQLARVVPSDQGFTLAEQYAGIFHFQFWQYGNWVDVIVDDRLPTVNGNLIFMRSADSNEFWTALVEKAYAKLMGSYEALKGGSTIEAMEDFTGGVSEIFDLSKIPDNMLSIMLKAYQRGSLMGCSIEAGKGALGLVAGTAYSVTSVKMASIRTSRTSGEVPLVRIRNPMGNEREWTGAWGDKSREWGLLSEDEKREMGLTFDQDGEFWMAFKDFTSHFQKLEFCNLGPESYVDGTSTRTRWESSVLQGTWKRRISAGGCRNFLDTFWTNPQYTVQVVDPDEDDGDNMGTLVVGLMQKDRRAKRKEGLELLVIGYCIYKLDGPSNGPLDLDFFKLHASEAKSTYNNTREVCGRHKLAPGHYCIVPSTFEPGQEGDFIVRIFSEKPATSGTIDEETGMTAVQPQPPVLTEEQKLVQERLRATFEKIAGVDQEIDAIELKDVLNAAYGSDFEFDGFSTETCRSMVAMMDVDATGKLGLSEFTLLWDNLRTWKGAYKKYDADRSGTFNSYELRNALRSVGFAVSNAAFSRLVMRYANKAGKICFDDFIHCCAKLRTMLDDFDAKKSGTKAEYTLDEFVQTTMYS